MKIGKWENKMFQYNLTNVTLHHDAQMMQFQKNGRAALGKILEDNSRAFLADEAGLGKTFTSSGVILDLAKKQWDKQEEGKETPFYALYVGPNVSLLQKCCNDIVEKMGKNMVEYRAGVSDSAAEYELLKASIFYMWRKKLSVEERKEVYSKIVEFLDANWDEILELRNGGTRFKGFQKMVYEAFGAPTYLLKPSQSFWNETKHFYEQQKKQSGDRLVSYDLQGNGKKIILFSTSIGLMGNCGAGSEKERELLEFDEAYTVGAVNQARIQKEKEVLQKFGVVLFDEYHRYFKKLDTYAESVFAVENAGDSDLKVLFISATPYQGNKSDINQMEQEYVAEEEDGLDTLPAFSQFAKIYFDGKCKYTTDAELMCIAPEKAMKYQGALLQADEKYKDALDKKKSRDEILDGKTHLQAILRLRMVRHERTLLSGNQVAESHTVLYTNERPEAYAIQLFSMRKQILQLQKAGFLDGAINWSKSIPWLLSFSTKYKTAVSQKGEKGESGYFKILDMESKNDLPETLFLSGTQEKMEQEIAKLPEQNIAFKQMCHANLSEDMPQLIWLPPTVLAYAIPADSIFAKHKEYSKLLVFGEYKFLQRGGALLLSEYATVQNKNGLQSMKTPAICVSKLLENCSYEIDATKTMEENLQNLMEQYADEKIAYALLASPYAIAQKMGLDGTSVEKAFNLYFERPEIKQALFSWLECNGYTEETMEMGLLRYCAEGNLSAVMWEWKSNAKCEFDEEYIRSILTRANGLVHIQTKETYRDKLDGLQRNCGFADRLTFDLKDNGEATGDASEKAYKLTQDAFNSPFYPFVLFAGRGAQEGFDFHTYCLRLMHLTLPRGAVSFDQRQGRIDRFRSLLVRRRVAELFGNPCIADENALHHMFAILEQEKRGMVPIWKEDEIFPNWQIKEHETFQSKYHFERMVPVIPYTEEYLEYKQMLHHLHSYRSTIGSCGMEIDDQAYIINLAAEKNI